jgi:hypothetical protein
MYMIVSPGLTGVLRLSVLVAVRVVPPGLAGEAADALNSLAANELVEGFDVGLMKRLPPSLIDDDEPSSRSSGFLASAREPSADGAPMKSEEFDSTLKQLVTAISASEKPIRCLTRRGRFLVMVCSF